MKKIIIHWTAGANQPNNTDYQHYHYLINSDGLVTKGKYNPEDNENCNDGKYAQHCGGGNTGAIGIALCGMAGFNGLASSTKYPLTAVQVERAFKLIAELSKQYNIAINSQTVMTHYEFGLKNPKTTSAGKIDITYLSCYPRYSKNEIGDLFRNKAIWYKQKL
ncbi:MAG: N-acetylmuramoyl-L-alanine amidase [Muribaculaceae bacterium]|nr:N-acetylmuramoyl-L-alanine amidase [Muribaculaceae bacterium]